MVAFPLWPEIMHADMESLLARPSIQKMDDEWEGIKDRMHIYIDR
jgi:hypothetical protein